MKVLSFETVASQMQRAAVASQLVQILTEMQQLKQQHHAMALQFQQAQAQLAAQSKAGSEATCVVMIILVSSWLSG